MIDKRVHEPARLAILTVLAREGQADFLALRRQTGLTKGNLSAHLSKLEGSDLVAIEKTYLGKTPHTRCYITAAGQAAHDAYCGQMRAFLAGLA